MAADPPFIVDIDEECIGMLKKYRPEFLRNGADFEVLESSNQVKILAVPECIMRKEINELQNNRTSIINKAITVRVMF